MKNVRAYYDAVRCLELLEKPFGGIADPSLYLKRTRYFMNLIGNPDRDPEPLNAYKLSLAHVPEGRALIVTGSFFLVETIRKTFYPEEFILTKRKSR